MGRPIVPSTTMLLSEPRSTAKEPATLGQGGQSGGAAHLAVLAQLLLETQRVHLSQQLLLTLRGVFHQVRVEVHLVVHLHFLLLLLARPSRRTMAPHRSRRIGINAHLGYPYCG